MAFRTLAAPILTLTLVSVTFLSLSAAPPTNYDESKVPSYQLPDPLVLLNGDKVTDAKTWITKRRPEILELIEAWHLAESPAIGIGRRLCKLVTEPRHDLANHTQVEDPLVTGFLDELRADRG